tara:strand:- start:801 stop:1205 length:405 start_codon:yes stop_codon:yes gene_type:complete
MAVKWGGLGQTSSSAWTKFTKCTISFGAFLRPDSNIGFHYCGKFYDPKKRSSCAAWFPALIFTNSTPRKLSFLSYSRISAKVKQVQILFKAEKEQIDIYYNYDRVGKANISGTFSRDHKKLTTFSELYDKINPW